LHRGGEPDFTAHARTSARDALNRSGAEERVVIGYRYGDDGRGSIVGPYGEKIAGETA